MKIKVTGAGKRFNREWIFRHLNFEFESGKSYAITGPNGSGKSTLLQVLSGAQTPSEGQVEYFSQPGAAIAPEMVFRNIGIAAPYLDLIEEMTAREFLNFHHQFKPLNTNLSIKEILSIVGLERAIDKQIRLYSSGMKQRVKLAQAIFSESEILLLDEPCTNLDKEGYALYRRLIDEHTEGKLILVSSNDPEEYNFCETVIQITDYRP